MMNTTALMLALATSALTSTVMAQPGPNSTLICSRSVSHLPGQPTTLTLEIDALQGVIRYQIDDDAGKPLRWGSSQIPPLFGVEPQSLTSKLQFSAGGRAGGLSVNAETDGLVDRLCYPFATRACGTGEPVFVAHTQFVRLHLAPSVSEDGTAASDADWRLLWFEDTGAQLFQRNGDAPYQGVSCNWTGGSAP